MNKRVLFFLLCSSIVSGVVTPLFADNKADVVVADDASSTLYSTVKWLAPKVAIAGVVVGGVLYARHRYLYVTSHGYRQSMEQLQTDLCDQVDIEMNQLNNDVVAQRQTIVDQLHGLTAQVLRCWRSAQDIQQSSHSACAAHQEGQRSVTQLVAGIVQLDAELGQLEQRFQQPRGWASVFTRTRDALFEQ